MLQCGKMERRSLGRRRWHVFVSQQWQIAEALSIIDRDKFETLAVPLTRPPVPILSTTAEATNHGLFKVNVVKALWGNECEAIIRSMLHGKHFDMDGVLPNSKVFAHVISIHEHGENVLVSAQLGGNHQVNICELAGVHALNPKFLLSLATLVNLGMGSFFMRLLVSMNMYFDTCVLDIRNEPPPQARIFRQGSWILHDEELQVARSAEAADQEETEQTKTAGQRFAGGAPLERSRFSSR